MLLKSFIILCVFTCISCTCTCAQDHLFFPHLRNQQQSANFERNYGEPKWDFVQQKLDHFNTSNKQIWKMRIQYNDEFFKCNGPIFIMLGGEEPVTRNWLYFGQMYDMARENGAYMLYTEHRFYGVSRPTSDLSIENLKYLTTDQALADVIQVIKVYKGKCSNLANSKAVVFGGSYAGNMALWIRAKYPKVIHAAVSSSAPLRPKADFFEYHEIVQQKLGNECSNFISKAIDQIRSVLGTPEGVLQVQRDFFLCQPLDMNSPLDIMYFFSVISSHFGSVVQYATGNSISTTCQALMQPNTEDEYTRLAKYLNVTLGAKCRKNYFDMRTFYSNPNTGTNKRQWFYQTCTQFGYFQTTTSENQPYRNSHPIEMYHSWCQEFFGSTFSTTMLQNGIARTNLIYGDLNPTRVVSIQGTGDPWFPLGISKDLNPQSPTIIIKGTSHCEDLNSISENDSEELKNAKLLVQDYVKKWLQED